MTTTNTTIETIVPGTIYRVPESTRVLDPACFVSQGAAPNMRRVRRRTDNVVVAILVLDGVQ